MATLKKVTLYVAALATLVACGGGGGDDGAGVAGTGASGAC